MRRSRDWRRFQYKRLKRKRANYHGGWLKDSIRLGILVTTPKLCSCPMCSGNWDRRYMGKTTRQEKLADKGAQEQLQELRFPHITEELP